MTDNEEWGEIEPVDVDNDFGEVEPLRWEEGDGGEDRLPEGEKNEWGGNLRNEGRKVLLRRDEDGKVNGYSTTSSMLVRHDDGKFAVVPTVVGGKELSQDDAVRHYAETGEHWGMADDEDSARKIAQEVHDSHMNSNQAKWNDWIHEHWDEVSDEIKSDRGMAYEHKKRTDPEKVTLMERLANDDTEEDRKKKEQQNHWQEDYSNPSMSPYGMGVGRPKVARKYDNNAKMDDLAELASEAGLVDWQVKRIRSESKTPEEMREALAYVAGNRPVRKGEQQTVGWKSVPRTILNTAGKMVSGVINLFGTLAGGVDEDARHSFIADDLMAKNEGEDFDDWLERVIDEKVKRMAQRSPAIRENLEKYFKWEAPIAGKEGMYLDHSIRIMNDGREGNWLGNAAIRDAKRLRNWLDERVPIGNSGSAVVDWLEGAASGIAQFAYLGPTMIAISAAEDYQLTRSTALESGKSGGEAERLAVASALFGGGMTAAFYYAPLRRWMNGKGIVPVQPVEKFTFSELSKAMGRFNAKREFLNQGVAVLEAGGIMGAQAAGNTALRQLALGQDLDLGEITVEGAKGGLDGISIGAIMGAGRILNARIKGARDYEKFVRVAAKTPDGRLMLARLNPDGMMDLKRFMQEGIDVATTHEKPAADFEADLAGRTAKGRAPAPDWKPTKETMQKFGELCDRAGLPPDAKLAMDILFDKNVANFLGETLDARFRGAANARPERAAIPEQPTIDAETGKEVPPSQALAKRVRSEFGVEPVDFKLPQTVDGKPKLVPMKWRDNKTGQENTSNLAHDPDTGVTIMEEADGTFSVHNETGDSDGAATIGEAVEKAKELALMGQYTVLDRERKARVIENERAARYGKKNVVYFNTMAEAADAAERMIEKSGTFFGTNDASQFRNPAVQDRDAFYTPDGTTAVILDNVLEVSDIPRILGHEIVGHGGPNAQFGGKLGAQVQFAENIRAQEFNDFKRQIVEGNFGFVRANSLDDVNRNLGEMFAHYASVNLDKEPSKLDKLVNAVNSAARRLKIRKSYSAADVKTMMAKWRDAAKGEGGQSLDLSASVPRFDFFPEEPPEAPKQEPPVAPTAEPAGNAPAAAPKGTETTTQPKTAETPAEGTGVRSAGGTGNEPSKTQDASAGVHGASAETSDPSEALKGEIKSAVRALAKLRDQRQRLDGVSFTGSEAKAKRAENAARKAELDKQIEAAVDEVEARIMRRDEARAMLGIKPRKGAATSKVVVSKTGKTNPAPKAETPTPETSSRELTKAQRAAIVEWRKFNPSAKIHSAFMREDGSVNFGYNDGSGSAYKTTIESNGERMRATPVYVSWKDFDEIHGRNATRLGEMEEFAGGAADIKAGRDAEKKPPVAPPSEVPEAVVKTNLGDIRVEAAQKRLNAARTFDERSSAVKELNREIEERDAPVIAEIEKRNADPKLRAQFIDKRDGTETEKVVDFVRSIEAEDEKGILAGKGKHFRLAKTNDSIKDCGLTGDYFTIRGGVILRHKGKDSKHSISADEWVDIAAALTEKKPLLVERYKAGENSYRIWTDAKIGGKTAIVGVDVKNVGKDMEVNSIATAFGASGAMPKIENVIYPKTKKEIQSFITRHNSGRSTESPSAEISVPQSGSGVKASMPKPAPSIKMKDEAAEKLAQKQEDDLAALFDTPEFSSDSIILSGDEVRKTMPGYDRLDWSTHVDRSGYVGARLEEQFQRLLKERKGKGNGTVVFLAGGNGAGKSTCVEAAELQNADFVIDSTLGNIDVAKKQIDAILANGQTPVIHFVYRAPGQALEGIRNRVKSGGHIVSPLSFANSHVKSRETLRLLSDTYGDRIQIRIYDNSVESVPELTLEQLEAKRKPDHAKLREEANFYLGHLRDREKAVRVNQGNATGSGAKGQAEEVAFDTPEFNPDVFQKRVGAVATLVKTYKDNGVAEFRTLATRMAERFPDKFSAMKPYLRGVWNAVADQMNLPDVSRVEAEKIYGTIETQSKEAANGRDLRHEGSSGVGVDAGAGGRGNNRDRPDGGVRATANGGGRPGGILAGGRVRPENPDGRVGRVGTGVVSGQFHGLAESEVAETGSSGSSSTAGGNAAVADSAGHADGELEAGGDTAANGIRSAASIKKNAKKAADATKPNPPRRDFVMTKAVEDAILEKKTARRVRNNLDAIKLIRELKARDYAATPEEQETLAKFVGWGGLREGVFGHPLEYAYRLERDGNTRLARKHLRLNKISDAAYELHKELRLVLNDNEYESAKASSSTAFYTPIDFVHVLHDALRRIGVKGGRFLGPSAGTGNFASAAGEYEKPVNWQFVEKDVMTGEMLRALFPNQRVNIGGFEETKFPDGFFDFAIDNVPYADVPISDRSLSSKMFKIHDYFFAKTLAKLRPGGVMAFLTSTGTLDKTSPTLRQFLTKHGGKIVGAVRLPNGFFAENAGTDVASDLVIVQKVSGRPDNSAFEKGVEYGKTDEWVRRKGKIAKPLTYNGYFRDHPGQVIGKMEIASGQFGPTLKYTMPENADEMLMSISGAIDRALDGVDKEALLKSATVAKVQEHIPIYDAEGLRQGNVTMKGGKPFIKSGDMLEPISLPNDRALAKELAKRLKSSKNIMDGLIDLRKAMRDVIDAQMNESDGVEADLAPLWAKLNDVYDEFVKKNGSLHDKWVLPFVMLDKADGNRMLALERTAKDENGKPKIVKSDIFSKRIISRGQRASKADTPKDALVISYSETGTLNVPRIAELLDTNEDTAVEKLKEGGDVFENPQTGRLEPSWEYLSGRVRAKLAAARAAVDAGEGAYRANIEALEKVRPPMVRLEDTEIKFGATWVDAECMKDFLRDAFGSDGMRIALGKNEVTGQWNVDFGRVMNENPWGETSWSPMDFVSRVLNHGSMNHFVTDPVDKKRYLDERQTEANKLAAEKLHHAFSQFIQSSEKWAEPCYERYNAVMTDMVELRLPINILPFREAGMSEIALGKLFENGDPAKPKKGREYQSAVIARGVLGGNSLCLAHCVGAGKTLEMQSIGILGRHLGMFKKPMYVVPNHMLEQFTNKFVEAFPNANILKMSEADVKPERRRAFFAQVANGDWDAIVVKHSTFSKKLGMSSEYQKKFLEEQIRDLNDAIEAMRDSGERISVDQANKKKERLEKKLEQLANEENHDSQIVPFEELGVDQLFVDEAHNFKGMPITTSQGRTGGLSQEDSQRAVDMQMKTEYVQSLHGGDRGVVFATGTPLSNAPVVEAYVMLKYLAPNKLEEQGLKHFDDFVSAFGRITTESEFSHDGKTVKEKEKVSAFVNIPELMKLLRSVVDIVNQDQLDIPRPKPKYHMIDVDMTPAQEAIMEMVAREASTPPSRKDRNKYLTLTRIAKSACLTPRLLGYEDGGNKIIRAVAEIKKMYDETADNRGTQLVFTDIFNESIASGQWADTAMTTGFGTREDGSEDVFGTLPKHSGGTYNLNEEMRDLLVAAGIPKDEIAIIQDIDKSKGDKDANKSALFAKVSSGEVRVLIGSRQKMGEGTNVQERLAAIHLLHPGWKPAEDEQAIGRIIRFENTYKEGQIFYYLTKGNANIGSYETKNHQLIGVKSKLIDQVMHGDDTVREIDMDESAIDRDMLMGLASGNKALMELIDVKKRVHKLELNTESTVTSARRNKDKAEANARILKRRREEFAKEQEGVKEWREKNDGKSFILSTPDGRSIEKVKDMAEYVAAQMTKLLTQDRYDRTERTVLGDFNGVEMILTYDKYGDEKFRLAVPLLGVTREINYSGFIPDFSQAAMTAFKGKIFETVSSDFAKAYENQLADMDRQAKKMSADADRLQKDYEGMRDELIKLRTRQAELERTVTPLMIQAVEDRKIAAYGNWIVTKPAGSPSYVAQRESDAKRLSAKTVKELIPLMDAEDFASPKNAATKTADLRLRLKPNSEGKHPGVDTIPVGEVDFDTPEMAAGYRERLTFVPVDEPTAKATIRKWRDERKDFVNRRNGRHAELKADWGKIFSETAKKKSADYTAHYSAANRLDTLFENAVKMWGEPPRNGSADISAYSKYGCPFVVGNTPYLAKITVKEYADAGQKDGFYSIEAISVEKISAGGINAGITSVEGHELDPDATAAISEMLQATPGSIAQRGGESKGVDFDMPDLSPEEPVPETFGLTNDDIEFARKVAEMKPIGHVVKSHEFQFQQANALLSNREYMEHLAQAVAKVPRATSPHVDLALGLFHKIVEREVNVAREKVKALQAVAEELKGEKDSEFEEERKQSAQDLKDAKKELAAKTQLLDKIGVAHNEGGSEAARTLNLRRALANAADYSYAGIRNAVAEEMAKIKGAITPELEKRIGELADIFSGLDEKQADVLVSVLKPFAENELNKIKNGNKIKRAAERMPGDEAKRVMRNYNDALAQLEVAARETGGVFVGLADEKQPGWGKFLRAIAEYHCFENPDIKVDEVVQKMVETLHACGFENVDEVSVWDEWTGYGHSFRQSRYESQRRANWLRSQALHKTQIHHMDETNTLPLATGMQRDVDPTPEGRALTKKAYERKKEIPDEGRAERHLKGLLESAKTRIRNTIADLERAIETGEKIPGRDRTVPEDIELRELRKRKEELRKAYDEIFGTTRTLTDAQRIALAEKAAAKQLEYALADLDRARSGDFSKRPRRPGYESPTLDVLRERTRQAREEWLALKNTAFEFGMTPEEVAAYNARRIKHKEDSVMKYAERIATGDIRTNVKPKPPLPPELQKRYDELEAQQKKARQKMKQLREDARRAAWWPAAKSVADYWQYLTGMFVAHKASADRSAILRQALMLTAAHPVLAAKDMVIAEKAAWSKRKFDEVNADILADPIIRDAMENHGLKLRSADIANIHDVEMFSSVDRIPPEMIQRLNKLFDKIPGVGKIYGGVRKVDRAVLEHSERHYVTFLNLISSQTYKMLLDAIPDASDYQKRRIAYLVNMYSGHGAMSEKTRNNINSINNTLGHLIWSPSLAAAQIQQALFLDVLGAPGISREGGKNGFATGKEAAQVTKEAVKMRIRAELAILALGALLSLLWSDDDWKSEWIAKWKRVWNAKGSDKVPAFFNAVEATKHPVLGKTHVDLEMGKRTFNRILGLALTGEYETSTGRRVTTSSFGGKDLADMVGRYFYGKLSPHYSAIFSAANRKMFTGEPVSFGNMLADILPIPLSAKDVVQSAIEDEWYNGQAPVAITTTLLGAGGNVYDEKYYERAVNRYKEYKKTEDDPLLDENAKSAILESMRTSYPFLKDDVRYQIEDHIRDINHDKANIQKWRKQGATDDDKDIKEAETVIEKAKAAILELVRKNR